MAREPQEGVILTRKNRVIGVEISLVYNPAEDPTCRWQTECEHGNCVGHETRKLGVSFVAVPWEWCDECRGAYERLTATDQSARLARTPEQRSR